MDVENLIEVSPGVWLTSIRAASEALFKDLTNGWVITTQTGLIDCIEEHMKAYTSSILSDLEIARKQLYNARQQVNIAEAEERRVKAGLGSSLEDILALKKRAERAEARQGKE